MTQEHFDTIPAINLDDVTGGGYADGYAIGKSIQWQIDHGGQVNAPPAFPERPMARHFICDAKRCVPDRSRG